MMKSIDEILEERDGLVEELATARQQLKTAGRTIEWQAGQIAEIRGVLVKLDGIYRAESDDPPPRPEWLAKHLPKKVVCERCNGSGSIRRRAASREVCPQCRGDVSVEQPRAEKDA